MRLLFGVQSVRLKSKERFLSFKLFGIFFLLYVIFENFIVDIIYYSIKKIKKYEIAVWCPNCGA